MGINKLYVGNLDYNVTKEELNELFSVYGKVNSISVATKDDGRSMGFAFIEFESAEDAERAIAALNKSEFVGRSIDVSVARERVAKPTRTFESKYIPGTKKLYIGNLPYSASEGDLTDIFSTAGAVKSSKIITDQDTGKSKGFGFVEMETEKGAEDAIKAFNDKDVGGRLMNVNSAREKAKKV